MDEYLFITMAKLKADRLRLEREQARTAPSCEAGRVQRTYSQSPRRLADSADERRAEERRADERPWALQPR